ncbi:hypothetical protein [Thalassotalea marina]|uniref:Uncharacterized protein n=1 Tax=Thalassotalea marina TaxID=1673741 RepID=A0A919BIV1_9GAMM|nr:hypothetical protein [Thalassotalea marina]GHF94860.1 hypothetical protein GCM10017161_23950 [Thalassotalea marina]
MTVKNNNNKRVNVDSKAKGWQKFLLGIFVATEEMPYTANQFVREANESAKHKAIWALAILFWAFLAGIFFISFLFFSNSNTLFNVVATTEKINVSSFNQIHYPNWLLKEATLYNDCDESSSKVSGLLKIYNDTSIEFLRLGTGNLQITLTTEDNDSVGEVEGYSEQLSDCVVVEYEVKSHESFTMAIDGVVKIGGEIKESVTRTPILLDGKISIADKAVLSQEYYLSEPYELTVGDMFSIKDQTVQSSGFVLVNESPGMKITYASKGTIGVVDRYKTESIGLKNSFWTKLYNDETVILLWVLLGAFYTTIKVSIRFCIE